MKKIELHFWLPSDPIPSHPIKLATVRSRLAWSHLGGLIKNFYSKRGGEHTPNRRCPCRYRHRRQKLKLYRHRHRHRHLQIGTGTKNFKLTGTGTGVGTFFWCQYSAPASALLQIGTFYRHRHRHLNRRYRHRHQHFWKSALLTGTYMCRQVQGQLYPHFYRHRHFSESAGNRHFSRTFTVTGTGTGTGTFVKVPITGTCPKNRHFRCRYP